jgi:hypothetical protein
MTQEHTSMGLELFRGISEQVSETFGFAYYYYATC